MIVVIIVVIFPTSLCVRVCMRMQQRHMRVQVVMVFSQMQPHAEPHQRTSQPKLPANWLGEKRNRYHRPDKRCC